MKFARISTLKYCFTNNFVIKQYFLYFSVILFCAKGLSRIYYLSRRQEIPGRSCPLWHSVCFTFCRRTTMRTGCIYPIRCTCQRTFAIICWAIIRHIWLHQWQFRFRHRHPTALLTMHQRNWFTPIHLT